jgi:hypothetical protein
MSRHSPSRLDNLRRKTTGAKIEAWVAARSYYHRDLHRSLPIPPSLDRRKRDKDAADGCGASN